MGAPETPTEKKGAGGSPRATQGREHNPHPTRDREGGIGEVPPLEEGPDSTLPHVQLRADRGDTSTCDPPLPQVPNDKGETDEGWHNLIFSKLSDILGRKPILLLSVVTFTLCAGVCGAAQTTTQLIIFRAFQGIGAAGVYSSCMIIVFEIIPPAKIPLAAAGVSLVFACALVLGPIFGGAINKSSTWRWIFLFNVPVGVVTSIIFLLALPNDSRHRIQETSGAKQAIESISKKIDFIGGFLLLGGSVLLVAALENAGLRHPWKSGLVAGMLAVAGILWILFFVLEWKVTRDNGMREPVLPWTFLTSRISLGLFLTTFFLGPLSIVAIFSIPQRFQVVNGVSALGAGIRLLPYTAVSPTSSIVMSIIAGKFKTVGFGVLSSIDATTSILKSQYGYQALAAFGCGANMTLLTVMTPYLVSKKDSAVAQGAIGQLRYMGAVIGVAIVTCILNSYVQTHLSQILNSEEINDILDAVYAVELLPDELQHAVRIVFANAYNLQMKVLIGFSAAQVPAILLMWQNKQVVLGEDH